MNHKGFTLVEVMVAIAIIAILLIGASAGLSSAQSFSRSTDRMNKASEIATEVDSYQLRNGRLPSIADGTFVWNQNQVRIGTRAVELKGFLQYKAADSTTQHTQYTFETSFGDYQICVQQESGMWEGVGSGNDLCP